MSHYITTRTCNFHLQTRHERLSIVPPIASNSPGAPEANLYCANPSQSILQEYVMIDFTEDQVKACLKNQFKQLVMFYNRI